MDSATGTFALEHLRVLAVVAGGIPCSGGRGPARAPGPLHPALPEPGVDWADSARRASARIARALGSPSRHDAGPTRASWRPRATARGAGTSRPVRTRCARWSVAPGERWTTWRWRS